MLQHLAGPSLVVALILIGQHVPLVGQARPGAPASRQGSASPGAPRAGARVPARLREAVARRGRARVIVGLAIAFAPEGLLAAADRATQRRRVAAAQDGLEPALRALGARPLGRFQIVPGLLAEVDAAALQRLAAQPGIAYVELDERAAPLLGESAALVGAPSAWASGYTGAGQAIAVLDTGVARSHPFFGGRVVSEACYSTTDSRFGSTSVCGATTGAGAAAPCGVNGCEHGTHVAGVAAGSSSSLTGIAPAAGIIAIQVFSRFDSSADCHPGLAPCVLSYTSDQIRGLERVYELRNTFDIAAANLSLGGGLYTSPVECDIANTSRKTAVDNLRSVGIATIAAAGNSGDPAAITEPSCISTAVSVGSTTDGSYDATPADRVSSFSNGASFLDLLAPGHWITSSVPDGGYATFRGTSMAAPHVAGAWAVLKSRAPTASVSQILEALTSTGTAVFDPRNGLTKPRINLYAALSALPLNCTYTVSPTTRSVVAAGATEMVAVHTQSGCAWTASSNAPFVAVSSGASGVGPGTVTVRVDPNRAAAARTGTLTIAGLLVTLHQAGTASLSPVDVNGDGRLDLIWQHQASGQIAAWLMNGTTLIDGRLLSPSRVSDTGWKIVGAGDADGDGKPDLVWQHGGDGRVALWLMDGTSLRRGDLLSIPQVSDLQWRIRAVGDFDGDGLADLVWQHAGNGSLTRWRLHGSTVVGTEALTPSPVADTDWKIVGSGDFNRDGRRDLVWRHDADGRIAVWYMNGTAALGGTATSPSQVDRVWQIRAVGDLDGDGWPDLVWQHAANGGLAAWLMNGLTQVRGLPLSPAQVADTGWQIVGPR